MLGNFKKAIFRVLCLGALGLLGLMAEPNPEELLNLGMLSYDKQDFSKAKKYLEKACELNSGGGCGALGMMYENGRGVEKNSKKAAQLYSKACELKDGWGCSNLGVFYHYGEGVEKDFKKAVALYKKACDLNNSSGCGVLGILYENGQGVEKNLTKATQLTLKHAI
ncbi:hypothetical protein JP0186_00590 [Helicobacter pylori]